MQKLSTVAMIGLVIILACVYGCAPAEPSPTATLPPPTVTATQPLPTSTPTPPLPTPTPIPEPVVEGWAVLAERDFYEEYGMADLPVDYVNMERVHTLLTRMGWDEDHILELREFDQENLRDALGWLADNAGEEDIAYLHVSAHGIFLHEVVHWTTFFPPYWAAIPSQRRVLTLNCCRGAIFTGAVNADARPHLSIAATGREEDGWAGLEEEGLPIIGEVFTYYYVEAFDTPGADSDGDGAVSVQEAAAYAEAEQRSYMHDVVFEVPEFEAAFRNAGFPVDDPDYPHVVVDDTIGEPVFLDFHE
jgi:hypothetical protein